MIYISVKLRERLMFKTLQNRQVCSELSKAEEEPSMKRVGGFLMRCQEQSKLNSRDLCRAIRWVKRTVRVQDWTVNTENSPWKHRTWTCRVALYCRVRNFEWTFPHESGRLVFLEASATGMSDAQLGGILSIWSDSKTPPQANIWGHKRSHLHASNYTLASP